MSAPECGKFTDYVGGYGPVSIVKQGGELFLRRGRRPPLLLQPLGEDLFAIDADSNQRIHFVRASGGKVLALESLSAQGDSARYVRVDATR